MNNVSNGRYCYLLGSIVLPLVAAGWLFVTGKVHGVADSGDLIFDTTLLSGRGIDPNVAQLFRKAPRFLPGETSVELTVNGNARGRVKVRFNQDGVPCIDRIFLRQAGLALPSGYSDVLACFDLHRALPRADIQPIPAEGKLILVVPPEAFNSSIAENGSWQHGGVAGMLNYDAQHMNSSGGFGGVNFTQLGTEAGFNAGDWIVRSSQTFTRFNNENKVNHQAAYVQRTFAGIKKILQAGQISLANSLFGTGQVLGLQVFPESALSDGQQGAGLVEGVAETQSVVEVRQAGVLIYNTTIPAGPFRLQGFTLLNTRTDLMVKLTGSNGQSRQFVVPAATLLARVPLTSPGLSFGIGRLDQQGGKSPVVGTVATGWQLSPFTNLIAGVLGSAPYRAGSLNLDTQLLDATRLSLQMMLAHDNGHGKIGTLLSALVSHSLSERLSINFNVRQQTSGYRELSDALQRNDFDNANTQSRSRYQWGAGISWSLDRLGSLSLSWARTTTFSGNHNDYLRGGWSRQFGRTYLGLSLEHNTGTVSGRADDRVYASLSMPLGEGRDINSYLNTSRNSARTGIRYNDRTSQDRGWSIASDHDLRNKRTSASGSVDFVTPVSQLSASLSHDSDNYTTWSGRASGAAVIHNGGVTLSPYRVGDTFGIARVGKESGVRVQTPSGPTWTDGQGYAVLPTLNSYRRSGIQVDTRSLAKNVDISNAWQETEMARGAIGRVDFDVIRTRRVLVDAKSPDGQTLPHGASVFDGANRLVTVVSEDGTVFVPDATRGMTLEAQHAGKTVCKMTLNLPEKQATSGLYETAAATCR